MFIFEKKIADKIHKPRRRETVSEVLRKEVQYLQKIKHPKFLGILHPLEECQYVSPNSSHLVSYIEKL